MGAKSIAHCHTVLCILFWHHSHRAIDLPQILFKHVKDCIIRTGSKVEGMKRQVCGMRMVWLLWTMAFRTLGKTLVTPPYHEFQYDQMNC